MGEDRVRFGKIYRYERYTYTMPSILEKRIKKEGVGIFVNRDGEKATFTRILKGDLNVSKIMLYGEGGIGKTALLKEMMKEAERILGKNAAYSLIDFDIETMRFSENTLIKIRRDLGKRGMKFPLFDTAFMYYWNMAHPGTELKDEFSEMMEWAEIPMIIIDLESVARLIKRSGIRDKLNKNVKKYVKEEIYFLDLLKRGGSAAEILKHLPALIDKDMKYHKKNQGKKVILFFDNIEKLKDKNFMKTLLKDMERPIFVMAGREKIKWRVGNGEHYIQITELDEDHAKKYLEKRGVDKEIYRDMIYRHMGGHPFGLGLATELYAEKSQKGEEVSEDDFKGNKKNYRRLTERFLSHLDKNERFMIKILSLYDWWDREIFFKVSDEFRLSMSKADFNEFTERSFVEVLGEGRFVLHDLMRKAISSIIPDEQVGEDDIQEGYELIIEHFCEKGKFEDIKDIDKDKADALVEFVKYIMIAEHDKEDEELCEEIISILRRRGYFAQSMDGSFLMLEADISDRSKSWNYESIGLICYSKAYYDKALKYYQKALEIGLKAYGTKRNINISSLYNNIGMVYESKGDYNKAIEYCGNALKIYSEIPRPEDALPAIVYFNNIASIYKSKGDYDTAIKMYNDALELLMSLDYVESEEAIAVYNNIGTIYKSNGNDDKAHEYYQKALEIGLKIYGTEEQPEIATVYNNIGRVYESKRDYDKALEYYEKSLEIGLKIYGTEEHPDIVGNYTDIGDVYRSKGDYEKALEYYQRALEIGLKAYGTEVHPEIARFYNNMGVAHESNGEYNEALRYYEKALDILLKTLGSEHFHIIDVAENMLHICEKLGNNECIKRCEDILENERKIFVDSNKEEMFSSEEKDRFIKKIIRFGLPEKDAVELVKKIKEYLDNPENQ